MQAMILRRLVDLSSGEPPLEQAELPLPEPGRASITFAHAAMCILFALVAQGALVRVALPLATVLYGWAYFSSQLDSYQHHYLVWLLLVILLGLGIAALVKYLSK